MAFGRLIRVGRRDDSRAVSYVVAADTAEEAVELIRKLDIYTGEEVEDLGRVPDVLMEKLNLRPGQAVKLNGRPA